MPGLDIFQYFQRSVRFLLVSDIPAIIHSLTSHSVAKDQGWFTEYTPFETHLGDSYGMMGSPLQVIGIGTVELSTEAPPDSSPGSSSPSTLRLAIVLHAPSILCNIIGRPIMDDHGIFTGPYEGMKGYITDQDDRRVAYFDPSRKLFQPKLRDPPPGYYALQEGSMYMINAQWSDSEREKWRDYQDNLRDDLSAEEKAWLKKHSGNEYRFLQTYGLSIYKDEDREKGKSILRDLMQADKS